MDDLTIGRAARQAGIGVETIRFYERRGLIEQPRKPYGGFRVYPEETVQRIQFIRQAQDLGFSLREIDELLALRADPQGDCTEVRRRARDKLGDVTGKIAHLERIRAALEAIIAVCPGRGALDGCTILEAMSPHPRAVDSAVDARHRPRESKP